MKAISFAFVVACAICSGCSNSHSQQPTQPHQVVWPERLEGVWWGEWAIPMSNVVWPQIEFVDHPQFRLGTKSTQHYGILRVISANTVVLQWDVLVDLTSPSGPVLTLINQTTGEVDWYLSGVYGTRTTFPELRKITGVIYSGQGGPVAGTFSLERVQVVSGIGDR